MLEPPDCLEGTCARICVCIQLREVEIFFPSTLGAWLISLGSLGLADVAVLQARQHLSCI